jgi:hypothetical protein
MAYTYTACKYDPSKPDDCTAHKLADVSSALCVLTSFAGDLVGYDSATDPTTNTNVTVQLASGASLYQAGGSWWLKLEGFDFSVQVAGKTYAQKAFTATASCVPWSNLGLSGPPGMTTVQNANTDVMGVPADATCVLSTLEGYGNGARTASIDGSGLVADGLWAAAMCFSGTSGTSGLCGIASVSGGSTKSACL